MFDPEQVGRRLRRCWSEKSSKQWSVDNPANGQCAVTALVLQDVYGGRILKTRVGRAWHFYNEIDGRVVDMSSSQFSANVDYTDEPATRADAMADCSPEEHRELSSKLANEQGVISMEIARGSCHCGAVVFEVALEDGLQNVRRCNCSLCRRKGAVMAGVPVELSVATIFEAMIALFPLPLITTRPSHLRMHCTASAKSEVSRVPRCSIAFDSEAIVLRARARIALESMKVLCN